MTTNKTITVNEESNKKRLDVFLVDLINIPRSQIQKMVERGFIQINNIPAKKAGVRIKTNDIITVDSTSNINVIKEEKKESKKNETKFSIKDIEIVANTDNYFIVNKPAGLLIHPTEKQEKYTLASIMVKKYPELKNIGESEIRPGIVHRLDKDASGILVIAKTQKMFNHLKKQFKDRKIYKEYFVLVHGAIDADYDKINFPIVRSKSGEKMVALPVPKLLKEKEANLSDLKKVSQMEKQYAKSRDALTEFWIEKKFINFTLLKVRIHTGRMHQIRVHMLAYNHPIIGDNIYSQKNQGDKYDKMCNRIFLHSAKLCFTDLDGNKMEYTSTIPDELQLFLTKIK